MTSEFFKKLKLQELLVNAGIIYLTLKQHLTPSLYRITDWDRIMCFSDFMYDRIMYVLVTSYLTELCVLEPS